MEALKVTEKIIQENAFEHNKMKPGLSANRPSNNWAPGSFNPHQFSDLWISNSYISNSMCTDGPLPSEKNRGEISFLGRGRLYTGYFSYSFGTETINTLIRSRSSRKNHTRYQSNKGEVYTRFQTKIKRLKQGPRWKEKKYTFSNKRNFW